MVDIISKVESEDSSVAVTLGVETTLTLPSFQELLRSIQKPAVVYVEDIHRTSHYTPPRIIPATRIPALSAFPTYTSFNHCESIRTGRPKCIFPGREEVKLPLPALVDFLREPISTTSVQSPFIGTTAPQQEFSIAGNPDHAVVRIEHYEPPKHELRVICQLLNPMPGESGPCLRDFNNIEGLIEHMKTPLERAGHGVRVSRQYRCTWGGTYCKQRAVRVYNDQKLKEQIPGSELLLHVATVHLGLRRGEYNEKFGKAGRSLGGEGPASPS